MPDWKESTPPPEDAQVALTGLVVELRTLDQKLGDLAPEAIPEDTGNALGTTLRGTVHAVRSDLLADAIETLDRLTTLTEEEALADLVAATDASRGLRLVEEVSA